MAAPKKYSQELRDRATRMALDARRLHGELGLLPPAEYEATYWASHPSHHYRKNPVLTEAGTR